MVLFAALARAAAAAAEAGDVRQAIMLYGTAGGALPVQEPAAAPPVPLKVVGSA